jgi:hypothetical protein
VNPKPIHFAEYTGSLEEPVYPHLDECTIDGGTEKHVILLPPVDLEQILHAARVFIEPWTIKPLAHGSVWVDAAGNETYQQPDMLPPWMLWGAYSTLENVMGEYIPTPSIFTDSLYNQYLGAEWKGVYDYRADADTVEAKRFKWRWSEKFATEKTFWVYKLPRPITFYRTIDPTNPSDPIVHLGQDYHASLQNINYIGAGASKWAPAQEVSI